MARTNSRSTKMNKVIVFRAHEEDIANLKLAAMSKGKDVSGFIREILVRERVLNPI